MENKRKIESKEIHSRLIPRLLVVLTRQLEILVTTLISVRRHIIVELHEQELQSFTEPSIQEGAYYAVEYQETYYFGRALGRPDGSFINFKFLHSASSCGAKVFDWPRRDDNDRVHSSCVFYGPVVIVGVGPFTFPQLSEVEQVYQWLRKSRKRS